MKQVNRRQAAEVAKLANLPYAIQIRQDLCDGQVCYMAVHPELYGCMAQGETPAEAVGNLKAAREDYITALVAAGASVPLPAGQAEVTELSGTGIDVPSPHSSAPFSIQVVGGSGVLVQTAGGPVPR